MIRWESLARWKAVALDLLQELDRRAGDLLYSVERCDAFEVMTPATYIIKNNPYAPTRGSLSACQSHHLL